MMPKCAIGVRLVLLAVSVLLSGCRATAPLPEQSFVPVTRILVLPFEDLSAVYGESTQVRCPVSGKIFLTGPVSDGAVGQMTDMVVADLASRQGLTVIAPGQGVGAMSEILRHDSGDISQRDLWIRSGHALKAEAIMVGYVYRFRQRHGTDYAVDLPASVAFDLHLLDVADGRVLWSRSADETQQALSENLLSLGRFFQRGGRWVTADELGSAALEQLLASLPLPKRLDKSASDH